MSREHKYRAWFKREQKMYEVSAIYFGVKYGMAPSDRTNVVLLQDKSEYYREGDQVDIIEYVGRKDRKGQEIYECDILGNEWGKYSIYWDSGGFIVRSEDGMRFDIGSFECESVEVIGNIYEHPEMIEMER